MGSFLARSTNVLLELQMRNVEIIIETAERGVVVTLAEAGRPDKKVVITSMSELISELQQWLKTYLPVA